MVNPFFFIVHNDETLGNVYSIALSVTVKRLRGVYFIVLSVTMKHLRSMHSIVLFIG